MFKSFTSCCASLIMIAFLLCGCQANPLHEAIKNKNDGSFDAAVIQSASSPVTPLDPNSNQSLVYSDVFFSTDGSVEFSLNIAESVRTSQVPVVEVIPHYLTEEDAKRIANVLFEGGTFYEMQPAFDVEYSKADIQEAIHRWTPYTSVEKLAELYGPEDTQFLEEMSDSVKTAIQIFTELSENASTENFHKLCKWTFQPDSYYEHATSNLQGEDLSQDNERIAARVTVDDTPYYIGFSKRDQADYKLNYICAYPHSYNSPMGLDSRIFRSQLCRTEEPTDTRMEALKTKAQELLDRMELGDWIVDTCTVQKEEIGEYVEYIVKVSAVPVFNDMPAIRRPQLSNLKSKETFASNYYLTDANFSFSANGDLVKFEMYSPVEIKEILNENVAMLSIDELMEKAVNHLSLSDYQAYGVGGQYLQESEEAAGEKYICKVDVCDLDVGMIRVKVPNTDESYYYVPGILLSGTIDYYGKDSGKLYESSGVTIYSASSGRTVPLVAFNAIDGSIIELQNE